MFVFQPLRNTLGLFVVQLVNKRSFLTHDSQTINHKPFESIPQATTDHSNDLTLAGGAQYLHQLVDARHQALGPVFAELLGGQRVVFVCGSALTHAFYSQDAPAPMIHVPPAWRLYNRLNNCERGLLFMQGDKWRYHRRLMNRYFTRKSICEAAAAIDSAIVEELDTWSAEDSDCRVACREIEVLPRVYNLNINVISTFLFGPYSTQSRSLSDSSRFSPPTSQGCFSELLQEHFTTSTALSTCDPEHEMLHGTELWNNFHTCVTSILKIVNDIVEREVAYSRNLIANGRQPEGILGKLILHSSRLEARMLAAIICDLFIAGTDTTAQISQWIIYHIARDTSLQQKMHTELSRVVSGGPIQVAMLDQVPLLQAVVNECLRLYPVAPFIARTTQAPIVIGGYQIPANTLVVSSVYSTCHSELYYSDPTEFRPSRWLPVNSSHNQLTEQQTAETAEMCTYARQHRVYAFTPFSLGARACIGRLLAETQMRMFLARWLLTYSTQLAGNGDRSCVSPAAPGYKMNMVGVMDRPLFVCLRRREFSKSEWIEFII